MSRPGAPFGYDNHYDPDRNKAMKNILTKGIEKPEPIQAWTGPWAYVKHKITFLWLWISSKIWKRSLPTAGKAIVSLTFPPEVEAAFEKVEAERRVATQIMQNDKIIEYLQDIAKSLREVSARLRAVNESPAFDTELSDKLAASEAHSRQQ